MNVQLALLSTCNSTFQELLTINLDTTTNKYTMGYLVVSRKLNMALLILVRNLSQFAELTRHLFHGNCLPSSIWKQIYVSEKYTTKTNTPPPPPVIVS